ncbi:hypothetical protein DFS34DRAFT_24105 [Phlyctochytrium arcticum]|nr:hypothetical protein DFS34DRAFT_24105 [Phlyctochytrium arcticum]
MIPLTYADILGYQFQFIIRTVAIIAGSLAILICMFGPKLLILGRKLLQPTSVITSSDDVGMKFGSPDSKMAMYKKQGRKESMMRQRFGRHEVSLQTAELSCREAKTRMGLTVAPWCTYYVYFLIRERIVVLRPALDVTVTGTSMNRTGKTISLMDQVIVSILSKSDDAYIFETIINGRIYQWQADTEQEMNDWFTLFKGADASACLSVTSCSLPDQFSGTRSNVLPSTGRKSSTAILPSVHEASVGISIS